MNLGENLINLRKKENISQEELAEKLDVSRQAISKWESGNGYPEMEKIIKLSEIFNCSIDSLIKGNIKSETTDLKEYDKFMLKFGKSISIGIFIILIGVTLFLLYLGTCPDIKNLDEKTIMIGSVLLLIFILLAVPIFIINGLKMDSFRKKHSVISNNYTNEEEEKFDKKFAIAIAISISIILIGVIQLLIMLGLKTFENDLIPVGLFMIYITLAAPFLVYYGIQKSKYDIRTYNKTNENITNIDIDLVGKISAVIMIITTIIYLITGFIYHLWKINWLLFPIGGMICGIFAIIFDKKE